MCVGMRKRRSGALVTGPLPNRSQPRRSASIAIDTQGPRPQKPVPLYLLARCGSVDDVPC